MPIHATRGPMPSLALYVARDKRCPQRHDLGSVLCMQLANQLPAGAVEVVAVETLASRPAWLQGTPTLVAEAAMYRGHQALTHLQQLVVEHAAPRKPARAASARQARPAAGQARPAAQATRPAAPPAQPAEEEMPALWESAMLDEDDDEPPTSRKITSEDLARAVQERAAATAVAPATASAPPPPPPPIDD